MNVYLYMQINMYFGHNVNFFGHAPSEFSFPGPLTFFVCLNYPHKLSCRSATPRRLQTLLFFPLVSLLVEGIILPSVLNFIKVIDQSNNRCVQQVASFILTSAGFLQNHLKSDLIYRIYGRKNIPCMQAVRIMFYCVCMMKADDSTEEVVSNDGHICLFSLFKEIGSAKSSATKEVALK